MDSIRPIFETPYRKIHNKRSFSGRFFVLLKLCELLTIQPKLNRFIGKRMKKKIGLIVLSVAIIAVFLFQKSLYSKFVYDEKIISLGCSEHFCIGDTYEDVILAMQEISNLTIAYNDGQSIKLIDAIGFSNLEFNDFEQLSAHEKRILSRNYARHLHFKDGKLVEINLEYTGPLYFDL